MASEDESTMRPFIHRTSVTTRRITQLEGLKLPQTILLKELAHGQQMILVEVEVQQGTVTPRHQHDHESILYVLTGRVRVTVGDEVQEVGPGDACIHPPNVPHFTEALETSRWIEIKSPPRIVW